MRRRTAVFVSVLALLGALSRVHAAEPALSARLGCPAVPVPGRVLCEVELDAASGELVWADALVVESPDFARPLRARVGPPRALGSGGSALKLPLAFMATRSGRAPVQVVARGVICTPLPDRAAAKSCSPKIARLGAELAVGEGL
jgi:hypothetical protein